MATLYFLTTEKDNLQPRYIGITSREIKIRLKEHKTDARTYRYDASGSRAVSAWIRKREKEGCAIIIREIAKNASYEDEINAIRGFKILGRHILNLTDGGEGGAKGKPLSDAHKAKISAANKGRLRTAEQREHIRQIRLGTKASDETKRKMSNTRTGKKATAEHRLAISLGNTGKPKSKAHKLNLRLAKLGKKMSDEAKNRMSNSQKRRWKLIKEKKENPG